MHKHLRFRDSVDRIMEGTSKMYKKPLEWLEFSPVDVEQLTQNLHGVRAKMMQFLTEKDMLLDSINQKNSQIRAFEAEMMSRQNVYAELVQKVQILETKLKEANVELQNIVAEKKLVEGKFRKLSSDYGEHLDTMVTVVEHFGDIVQSTKTSRRLTIESVEPNREIGGPSRLIVTGEDYFEDEEEDPSEEEDLVQRYVKDEPSRELCPYRVVDGVIIFDED